MSKGSNLTILRGRLGSDPGHYLFADGALTARLRLATNAHWRGKDGEKKERTDWHTVKVHGEIAKFCLRYLCKGDHVQVVGSIRNDKVGEGNSVRTYSSVRCWEIDLLSTMGERTPRDLPTTNEQPRNSGVMSGQSGVSAISDSLPF